MSGQVGKKALGRLTSLGLSEPWQVALLLPIGWDDLTCPVRNFHELEPGPVVLVGCLDGCPSLKFDGSPRLVGYMIDGNGNRVGFTVFGDTREFQRELEDVREPFAMLGQVEQFGSRWWLKNPEVVPEKWLGRLRPRYPGKSRVIRPDTVRDRVLKLLKDAIPVAAEFIASELSEFGDMEKLTSLAGLPGWSLEAVLRTAHVPRSIEFGNAAQRAMECLAAMGMVCNAQRSRGIAPAAPVSLADWRRRAAGISFRLTDEQQAAVADACRDIAAPEPMRRILAGDVGTGKTAVYGTICATVIDAGGRAVVLSPTESLARQVAREFTSWWPDIPVQVVTGGNGDPVTASLVVGTTALLSREIVTLDLLVVDEQQKFSVAQREQLLGIGTNMLEVTATCIPRSQALIRYGIMKVSRLTKCHAKKTILTRIWQRSDWKKLVDEVFATINGGGQVLMVYPLREKAEDCEDGPGNSQLKSAQEIYEKWQGMLPGRVCWVHGQMTDDEKGSALAAMREREKDLMVATTVVEVGIDLPHLRRVIVVHPDRHGLTTLHQIRGRVARKGGTGWCDLFLPYSVNGSTLERLKVLESTTDGFQVAECDMRLRGIGDMAGSRQSGSDDTFLFGRPVSIEVLDEVIQKINVSSDDRFR